MSVLVTDTGFRAGYDPLEAVPLAELPAEGTVPALLLGPADEEAAAGLELRRIAAIVVAFPSFADGRGFTIARRLRRLGFAGRLRARGHLLADQYAMARRSGFDEVEIDDALAARQPEPQWQARADWRALDHRSRLGF